MASIAFITRFTTACCEAHLIADNGARLWRQPKVDLDLARPRVVRHERKAVADDRMEVEGPLVHFPLLEHRAVASHDIGGTLILALDVA